MEKAIFNIFFLSLLTFSLCGNIFTMWLLYYHNNIFIDIYYRGGDGMFGEFIKKLRIEKEISLRKFCRDLNIDASNWSKIERGVLSPPQDTDKLTQIAEYLNIKKGSDLYNELIDTAATAAGIIPQDLLSDKDTLNALPMFFKTVRSEKPSPEELENLIKKIRKNSK